VRDNRMIFDILLAVGIAVVAVIVFARMIGGSSVGIGAEGTAHAVATKRANEQRAAKANAAKKPSKKEVKRIREDEAAIEALIERDSKSVSGMTADKQEVVTLEQVREAKQKKVHKFQAQVSHAHSSGPATPVFTAQQKVAQEAHGFHVVETSDEIVEKRRQSKTEKAAKPQTISKKELLQKTLTMFFRGKRGNDRKKEPASSAPAEQANADAGDSGRVDVRRSAGKSKQWAS